MTGARIDGWRLPVSLAPATGLALLTAVWIVQVGSTLMSDDWVRARTAADLLLGGDLAVYADYPEAQMGPLALLLAAPFSHLVYACLVCALLPVALWLAMHSLPRTDRLHILALLGGVVLAVPWAFYAATGHADDALVALGAVGMVAGLRSRQDWLVCAAFLVAIAGKPTAALLVPLLLLARRPRRSLVVGVVGTALIWGVFVLADPPGFLSAGGGYAIVWPHSLPDVLGASPGDAFPAWVRPVQFGGGMLLCWILSRQGSPAGAVAAAFAFRAMLEPGGWAAYSTTVVLLALAFDLGRRRGFPVMTAAAIGSYVAAFGFDPLSPAQSALRIGGLLAVIACAGVAVRRDGTSEADQSAPRLTTFSVGRRL